MAIFFLFLASFLHSICSNKFFSSKKKNNIEMSILFEEDTPLARSQNLQRLASWSN